MSDLDNFDSKIDEFDRKILHALKRDGRMSATDLAQEIGLSKTPCLNRMKRLQADGYILGFHATLNPAKLNLDNVAFVEVSLSDTTEPALQAFNAAVLEIAEIEQCHMIAGAFDYLLKVRSRDMTSYRKILGETISNLPYVASSSTHVSMQAVKDEVF